MDPVDRAQQALSQDARLERRALAQDLEPRDEPEAPAHRVPGHGEGVSCDAEDPLEQRRVHHAEDEREQGGAEDHGGEADEPVEARGAGDHQQPLGAQHHERGAGEQEEEQGAEGREQLGGGDGLEGHAALDQRGDLRDGRAELARGDARDEHQHELRRDRRAPGELGAEHPAEDEHPGSAADALLQGEGGGDEEPEGVERGEGAGEVGLLQRDGPPQQEGEGRQGERDDQLDAPDEGGAVHQGRRGAGS
ncbi:MAG: hypothetical protein IPF99_30495 [Deltaproteobacteria bacterium]|nr:hypothetical protein [Deltaproteobacteria bacterium]